MAEINGIVARKLAYMDGLLEQLRALQPLRTVDFEENWQTKLAVERALQILVEIVIDVCQRLLAVNGQTPASTGREAIQRCVELGALSEFENYQRMVQFRNLVVHLYERVDPVLLVDIVNHHLGDFERFRGSALRVLQERARTTRDAKDFQRRTVHSLHPTWPCKDFSQRGRHRCTSKTVVQWTRSIPVFEADENVIAAWLFGSAHTGRMGPDSDIDFGVLFAQKPGLDELVDLGIALQDALGFENVDVVVLNDASPILRFEAISGRLLFCRDLAARAAFASLTAREYEESMALLARGMAARKAALARDEEA